jgi:hypothetical protein
MRFAICCEPFQITDGHRLVEQASTAGVLTGAMTYPAQDIRENVGLPIDGISRIAVVTSNEGDVAWHIGIHWARRLTVDVLPKPHLIAHVESVFFTPALHIGRKRLRLHQSQQPLTRLNFPHF